VELAEKAPDVYKWYLPTLSEVVAPAEVSREPTGTPARQRLRAEREWAGAIAALNDLLRRSLTTAAETFCDGCNPMVQAIVLSGPLPVVDVPELASSFATYTFTETPLGALAWMPLHLLPSATQQAFINPLGTSTISLMPNDPLAAEQFCLVLTAQYGLVVVLGEDAAGHPSFCFSFDPQVIEQSWQALRARLLFTNPAALEQLESQVERFTPATPDFRTVSQFSHLMLAHLPEPSELDAVNFPVERSVDSVNGNGHPNGSVSNGHAVPVENPTVAQERVLEQFTQATESFDAELLRAIAHEVRTPLTTIRTLTRLLLKRKDLSADVIKRLEVIDRECTDQIDRFNLFFRAVEVETAPVKEPLTPLAPISLSELFEQNLPRWQQQATQRNLTLEVILPQKLPMVVTDPTMLDQVLTGLIDRLYHTLSPGSHIQVRVTLAGHQLKLQIEPRSPANEMPAFLSPLKSLGQLLMFQPETGNLSLNMAVTKNLFQALGGKLTVKHKQQGEVLTVFLPLETRKLEE
jgi:signal transduction histidine kinase